MGSDSPFVIFFRKEKLETVIEYLGQWCHVHKDAGLHTHQSPSGKMMSLPFELKTPDGSDSFWYFFDDSPRVFEVFNISLEFDEDTKIYEYCFTDLLAGQFDNKMNDYRTAEGKFRIGGIDIGIRDYSGKNEGVYMMFFQAVSSDMSTLFSASDSIKNSFRKMSAACDVLLCFLYDEDWQEFEILYISGKDVKIRLPEYKCYNPEKTEFTMPRMILTQIKHNFLP